MLLEPPKNLWFITGLRGRGAQILYLALSLAGLTMLALLYQFGGGPQVFVPYQAQVTGTIFIAICLVGLIASVSPRTLRGLGHDSSSSHTLGHHPDCERFNGHIILFHGYAYCAGCTGLALGALSSIVCSVLYFYMGFYPSTGEAIFWVGVIAVAMGLIQHFIDFGSPLVHLILNVFLVFGSFMLASSMSAADTSFFIEAYHLVLVIFWVATRIRVSQEEHMLICQACGVECQQGFRATN